MESRCDWQKIKQGRSDHGLLQEINYTLRLSVRKWLLQQHFRPKCQIAAQKGYASLVSLQGESPFGLSTRKGQDDGVAALTGRSYSHSSISSYPQNRGSIAGDESDRVVSSDARLTPSEVYGTFSSWKRVKRGINSEDPACRKIVSDHITDKPGACFQGRGELSTVINRPHIIRPHPRGRYLRNDNEECGDTDCTSSPPMLSDVTPASGPAVPWGTLGRQASTELSGWTSDFSETPARTNSTKSKVLDQRVTLNLARGTHRRLCILPSKEQLELNDTTYKRNKAPWIDDVVSQWKNPVYDLRADCLPQVLDDNDKSNGIRSDYAQLGSCSRITRTSLITANVIGQVDTKFILISVAEIPDAADRSSSSSAMPIRKLLLLDQHAADERCRVEELFSKLFDEVGRLKDTAGPLRGPESNTVEHGKLCPPIKFAAAEEEA